LKTGTKIILLILFVLIADQSLKFWVKTTMIIGEEFSIFEWFKIHFVENEGMAFGLELGGSYGKLILSLFRIVAVAFIGYFLKVLIDKKAPIGFLISVALIFAGAIGNIIDSVIYGLIFSESTRQVADFMPEGGGYASLLHGRVVDMLYFPVYEGFLPQWIPYWGGDYFLFFRPVCNIADAAITLGVASIIVFQRSFFLNGDFDDLTNTETTDATTDSETTVTSNTELQANTPILETVPSMQEENVTENTDDHLTIDHPLTEQEIEPSITTTDPLLVEPSPTLEDATNLDIPTDLNVDLSNNQNQHTKEDNPITDK